MCFDDDTALTPNGDGSYRGELVAGWETPRGLLGGYVMAVILRGLAAAVDDPERSPRSVTVHFLRPPAPGPVTVSAAIERAGRSLTTVSGRLVQGGKTAALALGAYSKPWESPLLDDAPMPPVEPADGRGAHSASLRGGGPTPPFLERMIFQHRFGEPPFSGADHGETGGWLGLREQRPIDALTLAVLADAWFPAPWPRLTALAPAPTIELTVHFRVSAPIADGLLLGRFRSTVVRDGFFEEDGELWSEDGTLVAQSRQLGLLLGASAP